MVGTTEEGGELLQETIGCATWNDNAAEPYVNWRHFSSLLSLFIDAVVHYAEDELDDHCNYDDDAEDLMTSVEALGLERVSAQPI